MLALVDGVPRTLRAGPVHPPLRGAPDRGHRPAHAASGCARPRSGRTSCAACVKALDALDEVIALIRRSATVEVARAGLMELLEIDEIQATRDPRHAAAPAGRPGAPEDHRRARRDRARDRRATRRSSPRRSGSGRSSARSCRDRREVRRRPAHPDRARSTATCPSRTSSPRRTSSSRSPASGYAKRTKTDLYRSQKRGGKGVQGATAEAGRHRRPLLRLHHARLDAVLHQQGPGLPGQGVRAAGGQPRRARPARGEPAGLPAGRADRPGHRDPGLRGRALPGAGHQGRPGEEDAAEGLRLQPLRRRHRASTCATTTSWSAPCCARAEDDLLLVSAEGAVDPVQRHRRGAAPDGPGHSGVLGHAVQRGRRAAVDGRRAARVCSCWSPPTAGTRSGPRSRSTPSRVAAARAC